MCCHLKSKSLLLFALNNCFVFLAFLWSFNALDGYSMADIRYKWHKGKASVGIMQGLVLPQFRIVGHRIREKEVVLSTGKQYENFYSASFLFYCLNCGNYSRLICEIQFARSLGFYLIQIYVPASLIVVISWVSFWLHRNATPARVALGVTTVLTMTTLMSSTNAALPKISYIKSIDVFLGTCFVMVFASLLEYATVGYLGKRIAMRKSQTQVLVATNFIIFKLTAKMAEKHRQTCSAAQAAVAAARQTGQSGAVGHENPLIAQTAPAPQLCIPNARNNPAVCLEMNAQRPQINVSSQENRHKMCRDGKTNVKSSCAPMQNSRHSNSIHLQHIGHECPRIPQNPNPPLQPPQHPEMEPPLVPYICRNPNKMLGVSPSDIDKYSRVVFPVCFVCFNLMYWIIYLHISEYALDDLVRTGDS
ncbi:mutant GABA gated chloride channel-like protein [Leptotrombidium deliense]|uniref:Mutant GABA gated chloride channel-like protein n=1 Tax=Leptotrombidium deliense TaxID=299467 RepID=A0A443SRW0_9ACAR|nr:mutant GABA gated chloride channel-like protein [Leptotrombidium deliense]